MCSNGHWAALILGDQQKLFLDTAEHQCQALSPLLTSTLCFHLLLAPTSCLLVTPIRHLQAPACAADSEMSESFCPKACGVGPHQDGQGEEETRKASRPRGSDPACPPLCSDPERPLSSASDCSARGQPSLPLHGRHMRGFAQACVASPSFMLASGAPGF